MTLSNQEFTMKCNIALPIICIVGFASPSSGTDNPRCLAEYKAEEARIMRDAALAIAANPAGVIPRRSSN